MIDLDFTSEIFVPYQNLFENSRFEKSENVWVWNSDGTELFLDKGEPVLFRVEQEEWIDQRPTIEQRNEDGEVVDERGTAWRVIVSSSAGLERFWFANDIIGFDEPGRSGSDTLVGRARRRRGRG